MARCAALNALVAAPAVIAMEKAILPQKELCAARRIKRPTKSSSSQSERRTELVEVPGQGVWVFTRNISHPGNC